MASKHRSVHFVSGTLADLCSVVCVSPNLCVYVMCCCTACKSVCCVYCVCGVCVWYSVCCVYCVVVLCGIVWYCGEYFASKLPFHLPPDTIEAGLKLEFHSSLCHRDSCTLSITTLSISPAVSKDANSATFSSFSPLKFPYKHKQHTTQHTQHTHVNTNVRVLQS